LLGFLAVCATVVFSVAAPALVPDLVADRELAAANARVELARTTAFARGAVAGRAIGRMGGADCRLRRGRNLLYPGGRPTQRHSGTRAAAPARRHPLKDIRAGAVFVLAHPMLRPVFVTQFAFNTGFFFLLLAIFVPHVVGNLGLSATGTGLTLAMFGVGMVVGALCASRLLRQLAFGTIVALGPFAGLLGALLMALTIWLPTAVLRGSWFLPACPDRSCGSSAQRRCDKP
jgi:hypothetical protein